MHLRTQLGWLTALAVTVGSVEARSQGSGGRSREGTTELDVAGRGAGSIGIGVTISRSSSQVTTPPEAKAPPAGSTPARRRWRLVLSLGARWGGDPGSFEQSMRTAGLDSPESIFGGAAVTNPWTIQWGTPTSGEGTVTIGYAIRPWLEVRLQGGRGGDIHWETMGYRGPFEFNISSPGVSFSTEVDIRPVGAALVAVSFSGLRFGVGPSLNRVEVRSFSPENEFAPWTRSRPGPGHGTGSERATR